MKLRVKEGVPCSSYLCPCSRITSGLDRSKYTSAFVFQAPDGSMRAAVRSKKSRAGNMVKKIDLKKTWTLHFPPDEQEEVACDIIHYCVSQ